MTTEQRLLELAEKATPGPWKVCPADDYEDSKVVLDDDEPGMAIVAECPQRDEDPPYLASCDPDTIKKLCAVVAFARTLDAYVLHGTPAENRNKKHRANCKACQLEALLAALDGDAV